MGYTTDFWGEVEVSPPLNADEVAYLNRFSGTRRMDCEEGPYYVLRGGHAGQDHDPGVRSYNNPPAGQPGLWCQWVPNDEGTAISWDGGEKFYDADSWMVYLIEHFLKPGAAASRSGEAQFDNFTFDHHVQGQIDAQGEEPGDRWRLVVQDNVLTVETAHFEWS